MQPLLLLVEDNRADAWLLTDFLTRANESLRIQHVSDGSDALDFVFQRARYTAAARPDLIFLDLNLPKVHGLEVLDAIRKSPQHSAIPILVLTTSRRPEDKKLALDAGANGYLVKPSDLIELEALVHQLVRSEIPTLLA